MEIKFIIEKLNSKKCIEMIDEQINTRATQIGENKYTFRRDNAVVHTAKAANKKIRVLKWPSLQI